MRRESPKRYVAGKWHRCEKQVSEVLRNTPAICRKSYIAPCLFKLFDDGKLKALWESAGGGRAGLLAREQRLGVVLATLA